MINMGIRDYILDILTVSHGDLMVHYMKIIHSQRKTNSYCSRYFVWSFEKFDDDQYRTPHVEIMLYFIVFQEFLTYLLKFQLFFYY